MSKTIESGNRIKMAVLRLLLVPCLIAVFFIPFSANSIVCAAILMLGFVLGIIEKNNKKDTSELLSFLTVLADRVMAATVLILLLANESLPSLLNNSVASVFVYIEIAAILAVSCIELIAATKRIDIIECSQDRLHSIVLCLLLAFMLVANCKLVVLIDSIYQAISVVFMFISAAACIWAVILHAVEFGKGLSSNKGARSVQMPKKKSGRAAVAKMEYDLTVDDELQARATEFASARGAITCRMLQKELNIGYYRSVALMEHLVNAGVVEAGDNKALRKYIGMDKSL